MPVEAADHESADSGSIAAMMQRVRRQQHQNTIRSPFVIGVVGVLLLIKLAFKAAAIVASDNPAGNSSDTKRVRLERALASDVSIAMQDPSNRIAQRTLAMSHSELADFLVKEGELAGALQQQLTALNIVDHLVAEDSGDQASQSCRYYFWRKIAQVRLAQGDHAEALENFQTAIAIAEDLVKRGTERTYVYDDLPSLYAAVAKAFPGQGWWAKTRDVATRLAAQGRLSGKHAWMLTGLDQRVEDDHG